MATATKVSTPQPVIDESPRKTIWVITIGEPLPVEPGSRHLRSRILASRLVALGYDVTWWTSDFNHFTKHYHETGQEQPTCGAIDSGEGYRLRYLHGRPYRHNLSAARQINHLQIARDFTLKSGQLPAPAAVICSAPPIELMHAASVYCKQRTIPFLVDVRDLWPDEMLARIPRPLQFLGRIALFPLERLVRRALRGATGVVGVSQAYLDWGLAKAGRGAGKWDRLLPLGYPDSAQARHERNRRMAIPLHAEPKRGLHVLFSGSFNNSVDLDTFISAFRKLSDPEARTTICGTGERSDHLRQLASGDDRITFTGWIGSAEIARIAATADVGVVCYKPESLVALPNKLFEYISFGLPVVNSIKGEASAIVEDNGLGWNYPAGNVDALLETLRALSPGSRRARSIAAAKTYEARFCDSVVYDQYCRLVADLVGSAG